MMSFSTDKKGRALPISSEAQSQMTAFQLSISESDLGNQERELALQHLKNACRFREAGEIGAAAWELLAIQRQLEPRDGVS